MNRTSSVVFTALGLALILGATDAPQPANRVKALLDAIRSDDRSGLLNAHHQIVNERRELIQGLIEIAAAPTRYPDAHDHDTLVSRSMESKCQAIQLLGEIRADDEKVVTMLYENLNYQVIPAFGGYSASAPDIRHPAAGSLAQLGLPALERAFDEMERAEEPPRRELCTLIAMRILGREQTRARITQRLQHPIFTDDFVPPGFQRRKANLETDLDLLNRSDWP